MLIQWADFTAADKQRFTDCRDRLNELGEVHAASSIDRIVRHVMDDWLARTATEAAGQNSLDWGDTDLQGGVEKTP